MQKYVLYHRRETYAEKLDRNWAEILQELRILQTGLQLVAGFLLTLPFQNRFTILDDYAQALYLILVVTAAVALVVVLTPLSVHRWLFRKQVKDRLVASGAWAAKVALGLAALLIMGTSALIFDVVLGRWQSWVAGACLCLLSIVMFLGVPAVISRVPEPTKLPESEVITHDGDDRPSHEEHRDGDD
ncbi:hypothetical protein GCM10012320_04670 [Sinomonas cellulolyticus]|uniref:Sodium:proton antiporter n=1 Tax=Sinomonas cellulolyticus TaxID=2801916 RepID=A0ABS1K2A2_9MICC|nr:MULTISPECIES: DUF6328 family protein [Sinomonas]MBL0705799.1 sodium:proton antiporter [Sinomonas cellulolyticus]GHG42077.1 hypothetical protein GCM10012320_04670 [Sinomonas sp. KCTC 49339]